MAELRIMVGRRGAVGITLLVLAVLLLPVSIVEAGVLRPTHTLRVLAGSELRDVLGDPAVAEGLRRATGIRLEPTYTGTLQGVEQSLDTLQSPAAPGAFDLAWFSSPNYLRIVTAQPGVPKLPDQEFRPIMRSPVVIGVRAEVARRLGWTAPKRVTWRDVTDAAGSGRLTFASTDAAASNSGFSALASVAAAYDRTPGGPVRTEDIDRAALSRFFSGRTIKEESSGPLTDVFCRGDRAQALISYESEILAAAGNPACGTGPLQLVYPDAAVYADYPLVQLRSGARADAELVRGWLLSPEGQTALAAASPRRPVDPDVEPSPAIPNQEPAAIPLPDLETSRQLVEDYLDVLQRPARTVYVLDVSLSMQGERINELRDAVCGLAGGDPTVTSQFVRFRANERVTVIPFASVPQPPTDFTARGVPPDFGAACSYVRGVSLGPGGGTAIYDSLQDAYDMLRAQQGPNEGFCPAVVLMTDGENNSGRGADRVTPDAPTFTIRFGDAPAPPLQEIARQTGGRYFDATDRPLRQVFEETRSVGC